MDIFIVVVESKDDCSRSSLWIHASDKSIAKRRALRLAGRVEFKVIEVNLLGEAEAPKARVSKSRKKKKTKKARGKKK